MREIVEELERAARAGEELVLVTVVGSAGSVYRRAGAKTLLCPDGRAIGTISGGCLDTDLRERARAVLADRRPRLVPYDTRAMNDEVFGLGLGCGGEVEVWIETLDWWRTPAGSGILAQIRAAFAQSRAPVLATVLRRSGVPREGIERWLAEDEGGANRRRVVGADDIFLDRLEPPRRMIVVGVGPDAEPLVALASAVGFEVTVVSDRGDEGLRARFPAAREFRIGIGELARTPLHGAPAIVLVTHRSVTDREILRALSPHAGEISYLGLLGPRTRSRQLLAGLEGEGGVDAAFRAKLHGPAGLDLGSESPAEIALAIVAEALAVVTGRSARPLRDKPQ